LILISPRWDIKFHVPIDASNMVVGAMLANNLIRKCDQHIAYASRLLNIDEQNYMTTERKAFTMVYALHIFYHYLLGNKFIFYVDHMVLLYLV
jgi:hypothetical protein